jgi:hypothetical protein
MADPCMSCAVKSGDCVFKPDLGHDFMFTRQFFFYFTFKETSEYPVS